MLKKLQITILILEGKNVWFGVREFAMGAAVNGMAHMEVYILMVLHSSYLVIT